MTSYQVKRALRRGVEERCKELAQEIHEHAIRTQHTVAIAVSDADEVRLVHNVLVAELRKLDPEYPVPVIRRGVRRQVHLPPPRVIPAHPITDYLPPDVMSEVPWSFSFGDAAYTIVTVQAVIADMGDDFDVPQALRDLPDDTYICFNG